MSLHPRSIDPIPKATARVICQAFPRQSFHLAAGCIGRHLHLSQERQGKCPLSPEKLTQRHVIASRWLPGCRSALTCPISTDKCFSLKLAYFL